MISKYKIYTMLLKQNFGERLFSAGELPVQKGLSQKCKTYFMMFWA